MASTRSTTASTNASLAEQEIDAFVAKASARNLADVPALSAFQRQIDRYPQLSPAAQLEMVERARAGRAAAEQLPRARSERSIQRLNTTIHDGKRAMEYLAGSNFRLVLLICSEKAKERYGVDRVSSVMPDLVAEANVALAEAVYTFDESKCPVFATYVARVIRDKVAYVMSRDGSIRIASSWHRLKRIAAVRIPQLATDLGRQPTEDEIKADLLEQCMKWAYNRLTDAQRALPKRDREKEMLAKLRKQGMLGAIDSLNEVLALSASAASLDAPTGADGTGTLGELIPDAGGADDEGIEFAELQTTLKDALASLPERERRIIELRFGFGSDDSTLTYAQIGALFSITAERVRQIERAVLSSLAADESFRSALTSYLPSLN